MKTKLVANWSFHGNQRATKRDGRPLTPRITIRRIIAKGIVRWRRDVLQLLGRDGSLSLQGTVSNSFARCRIKQANHMIGRW